MAALVLTCVPLSSLVSRDLAGIHGFLGLPCSPGSVGAFLLKLYLAYLEISGSRVLDGPGALG